MDRVLLLREIPMRLRGTNFCTSSARFVTSFVRQPNGTECTQMVRNARKRQFRAKGLDRVRSLRKILTQHSGTNFCTSSDRFPPSFVRQPNSPECTQMVRKMHQNVSLGSNGVDQERSLGKILTRFRGTNFCTSSACFHRVS